MEKRNHTVSLKTDVRVLKHGACPSLSGKSKLKYEIGCSPDRDVKIRISANTGTGYFNDDWIDWPQLVLVLERHRDKPITSLTLAALFKGRSANSGGFLLAALKNEGLVQRRAESRCYDRLDGRQFLDEIIALMSNTDAPGKAAKVAKAVPAAKKARAAKA